MSSDSAGLMMAAEHLLQAINPPSDHAVSISTFFRPGRPLAIKVFVLPQYRHLISRVPETVDGYDVLREIASLPNAY